MKKIVIILLVVFVSFSLGVFVVPVKAEDCEDAVIKANKLDYAACLGRKQTKLEGDLNSLLNAIENNEGRLSDLQFQIGSLSKQVDLAIEKEKILEAELDDRSEKAVGQFRVLSVKTREFYKSLRGHSILAIIFDAIAGEKSKGLVYQSESKDQDRQIILKLSGEIVDLEQAKKEQKERQDSLLVLQTRLDKEAEFLEGEVAGARVYQKNLEGQIAELSAKQKAILAEKSGTFQTTVGDVPLADDPNSRPDYNPGFSPAFAAFSFGAPHFKGMSQYGAYGRAKSGQGVEDILKAYYGGGVEIRKDYPNEIIILGRYDNGKLICDQGSVDLETYAKRIYEMPGSWGDNGGMEALKAQAIAAKSYALATVKNKGCICMTESCQVYKSTNKGGKWEEAVNATAGWVMIASGSPLWAQYASTSGGYQESYSSTYNSGYATPAFWDTPSGRSGWTGEAYEKTAGSPWFYKGWYKSRSGDACGRSHPWLTSEEMADILNAWKALFEGGGDSGRVTPTGSCWGGNPYSMDELRGIGGFTSVSGASVSYSDGGITANVTFSTNKGSVSINGKDFYKAFNLRAPGRIALKSGLFNIEVK